MTAIEKLQAEMDKEKNPYVQVVGEFLLRYLEEHPESEEKVLAKDKTILKSLDAMKKVAEKQKVGNVAVLSDKEGFQVVFKYFGIKDRQIKEVQPVSVEPKTNEVDFDVKLEDFL